MASFTITTLTPEGVSSTGEMQVESFHQASAVLASALLSFIREGKRSEFPENYVTEQHDLLYSHEHDANWEFSMARVNGTVDTFTYVS